MKFPLVRKKKIALSFFVADDPPLICSPFPQAPTGGARRVMYMRMAAGSPVVGRMRPLLVRWCSVIVPKQDCNLAEVFALQART